MAAVAACLTLGLAGGALRPAPVPPFPAEEIRAQLPDRGCVQADAPATLALLDLLSANLDRGCPVPVDLSGHAYAVGARDADGRPVPRVRNASWQRTVLEHLTAGSAAVLARGVGNGFDEATARALARYPTVFRSGGVRVLLVDPGGTGTDAP
ncbi:hypothetical protein GC089_03490 [Cellulomonas sp. JZ18]|nr:hypothetical protein GC089_03490 [Cellulomonas sp. JZ18]